MVKIISIFLMLFIVISCDKKEKGPEGALRSFISYRFESSQDLEKIKEFLTGPLLDKVDQMTEPDLKNFMSTKGLSNKGLKLLLKKCSENKCNITYQLKYTKSNEGKVDYKGEVKKVAELTMVEPENWKISNIEEVRTHYEYKEPLE